MNVITVSSYNTYSDGVWICLSLCFGVCGLHCACSLSKARDWPSKNSKSFTKANIASYNHTYIHTCV